MAAGAEPLRSPGWGLFARWHALIDTGDRRFTMLSTVLEVQEPLARLEKGIEVSMWNVQRHNTVGAIRDSAAMDARLRLREVDMRFILPRRVAERRCPLASSYEPDLRLAPVAHPLMVGDGRWVLVGDSTGEVVWISRDVEVVADAMRFYDDLWQAASPAVPPGESPPFTPRMVQVGVRLAEGASDREIARSLGVSERTVSADVREMSRRLGARSRAHAIALISGVEA